MSSLITYACAYAVIFGAGIWYLLTMIRRGPHPDETPPEHGGGQTAARPLSVGDAESGGAAAASQGGACCSSKSRCRSSGSRPDARRVGHECRRPCHFRVSPYH